jgi:hypothetical protein
LPKISSFFIFKKEIPMSTQLNKNLIKKLVSIAGVASASVFLSLPTLALNSVDAGVSNQSVDSAVSNQNLVAQGSSGSGSSDMNMNGNNQPSTTEGTTGGINRANESSTSGGSMDGTTRMNESSTTGGSDRVNYTSSTTRAGNRINTYAITGGDSVTGFNWVCLNNPSQSCGESR